MSPSAAPVICLTPVKDEAWILDECLAAASLWADAIIVLDNGSSDESAAIARSHPQVDLFEDDHRRHMGTRYRLLIDRARKHPLWRVGATLVAVDADEMLSGEVLGSAEWEDAIRRPPGTVISVEWPHLAETLDRFWPFPATNVGFVDDGKSYPPKSAVFHSGRLPLPPDAEPLILEDVKLLHLMWLQPEKVRAKLRWYQLFEAIQGEKAPRVEATRIMRRPNAFKEALTRHRGSRPVPESWLGPYREAGIELAGVVEEGRAKRFGEPHERQYDLDVLGWLDEYGAEEFKALNVWDRDWVELARREGLPDPERFRDPRGRRIRWIHAYLERTRRLQYELPASSRRKYWMNFAERHLFKRLAG